MGSGGEGGGGARSITQSTSWSWSLSGGSSSIHRDRVRHRLDDRRQAKTGGVRGWEGGRVGSVTGRRPSDTTRASLMSEGDPLPASAIAIATHALIRRAGHAAHKETERRRLSRRGCAQRARVGGGCTTGGRAG